MSYDSFLTKTKQNNENNSTVIKISDLSKVYRIYDQPIDRLKQLLLPSMRRMVGLNPKNYHRELRALHDISLEVKKGESVGIIGHNGSGKSTLLRIISGITIHTKGDIKISGRVSGLLELGSGFNSEFTGRENIYINGEILGIKKKEMDDRFKDILEFSEIGELIDQPTKCYSNGMLLRLAFSLNTILKPEVLIIDEVLSVGDIYFQQKCFTHLKYNLNDCSKIFVTHDMSALSTLAERVIIINKGCIVYDGELQQGIKIYNKIIHGKSNNKESENLKKETVLKIKPPIKDKITHKKPCNKQISGIGNVCIDEIAISVDGNKSSVVRHGSVVNVNMKVEFLNDIDGQLVFGFFTKNRYSQRIFGQNSSCSEEYTIKKKGHYVVSFYFFWPPVARGEYTLTVGIGEIDSFTSEHKVQCWMNDFMFFSCLTDEDENGLFSVDLYKLKISNNEEL